MVFKQQGVYLVIDQVINLNGMTNDSTSYLQHRLAEGDEAALEKLHALFCNQLLQWAVAIIRSPQLAEEIVEDVFIKIWNRRTEIPAVNNLKSYLYTLTRNTSRDYLRKYSGKQNFNLDEVSTPLLSVESSPEDLVISAEVIKKINQAINDLPPKCKFIFKLVKIDGLKYREVADLLEVNIRTVETQMRIALKKLHTSLTIYLPEYTRDGVRNR